MDGLSAAASVIAIIQITESAVSLCSRYFKAVKNAKHDIELLQEELGSLITILKAAQRVLEGPNGGRLPTSHRLRDGLSGCISKVSELENKLKEKLDPGKTGKAMSRFGFRALKWPLDKD